MATQDGIEKTRRYLRNKIDPMRTLIATINIQILTAQCECWYRCLSIISIVDKHDKTRTSQCNQVVSMWIYDEKRVTGLNQWYSICDSRWNLQRDESSQKLIQMLISRTVHLNCCVLATRVWQDESKHQLNEHEHVNDVFFSRHHHHKSSSILSSVLCTWLFGRVIYLLIYPKWLNKCDDARE
jgi:hypothetical protein